MGPESHVQRGRPRESRIDEDVREAARSLLIEAGYTGATIGRIAERANVGRAALYRRWRSKAELLFTATVHLEQLAEPPDTGSLHGDLRAVAWIIHDRVTHPVAVAALSGIAAELRSNPGLAATLEARVFTEERRWMTLMLSRARERGEPVADIEPELVRQLLIGPIALAAIWGSGRQTDPDALAAVLSRGLLR